jgi:hypothetical protein
MTRRGPSYKLASILADEFRVLLPLPVPERQFYVDDTCNAGESVIGNLAERVLLGFR